MRVSEEPFVHRSDDLRNAPHHLSFLSCKKDGAAPGLAGRRCLWQKKATRKLRSRAFGGPLRSRPGKGIAARWNQKEKIARRG